MHALALASLFCTFSLGGAPAAPVSITANHDIVTSLVAIDETSGHIEKVAPDKMSFTLLTDTKKLTFLVNEKTAYTLNGEKSDMQNAIIMHAAARVVHAKGVATEVHVTTEG